MENQRIVSYGVAKELSEDELSAISGGSSQICAVISNPLTHEMDAQADGQFDF